MVHRCDENSHPKYLKQAMEWIIRSVLSEGCNKVTGAELVDQTEWRLIHNMGFSYVNDMQTF